jgi:rod shape-determining protein MreC
MSKKAPNQLKLISMIGATVLAPFVFFSANLTPWQGKFSPHLIFQEMSEPVEVLWDESVTLISLSWTRYFANQKAISENERLQSELNVIKTKILDYEEQGREIARLRKLLSFAEQTEKEVLAAEVVGAPRTQSFLSMRIGRGDMDGVQPGMPVLTPDGIAGRTVRTGLNYSDVQLITDPSFNLDVILQRTRVRGVLQGIGGDKCLLRLSRRADIRIGDTVVTSGIVGGMPKGIPVGRVMRISYESDNITQKITVEPWVDYRTIEEVVILKRVDATLLKIVETAGPEWLNHSLDGVSGG